MGTDRTTPGLLSDREAFSSEAEYLRAVAEALSLEYIQDLSDQAVPATFLERVPIEFSRSNSLVALSGGEGAYRVATCDPSNYAPLDELAEMLGAEVVPVLAPRKEIIALLNRASGEGGAVQEAIGELGEK